MSTHPEEHTSILWELDLSTRTMNALLRAGYSTIEILLGTHAWEPTRERGPSIDGHVPQTWPAWKNIPGVGRLGVYAIQDALENWQEEQALLEKSEHLTKEKKKDADIKVATDPFLASLIRSGYRLITPDGQDISDFIDVEGSLNESY